MPPRVAKKPAAQTHMKRPVADASSDKESMSLDGKMDLIKDNQDTQAIPHSSNDWKRINERFTQTTLSKQPAAKKVWERIKEESLAGSKQKNQRQVLEAFLLDPTCGKFFVEQTQNLAFGKNYSKEATWMSRKQLLDVYDESEAEEMLENGSLTYRTHPNNPKRIQFRVEQEKTTDYWEFNERINLQGSNELSASQHALASSKMRESLFGAAPEKALKMGLRDLLKRDAEGDDESTGRPSLKHKRKGIKALAPGPVDEEEEDPDDDAEPDLKDAVLKKSITCKKLENELKQGLQEFKSSPYASKTKVGEHTQKLQALQKTQTQLDAAKIAKMPDAKLKKLDKDVTQTLTNAKSSVQELKKLKKLGTGTVAYSEGGQSKRGRR